MVIEPRPVDRVLWGLTIATAGVIVALIVVQPAGWGWYVAASCCAVPGYIMIIVIGGLRQRRAALRVTSTVNCADIASYVTPVRCEVKGAAVPGPGGILTAPLSGTPCVWYRTTVEEVHRRESDGHTRTVYREVHREVAPAPFGISDATGTVLVQNADDARRVTDVDIDGVPQVVNEAVSSSQVRRGEVADPFGLNLRRSVDGIQLLIGPDGFRIREWALPAGQWLYALGLGSGGVISKPGEEPYIISTRSEEEVEHRTGKAAGVLTLLTVITLGAALILLIAGLN